MKSLNWKSIKAIVSALFMVVFISCGQKPDEHGLYNDVEQAFKVAKQKNQSVMVVCTMQGDDQYSDDFVNNIMYTDQFKTDFAEKYVIVHIDFGQSTYEKTIVNEEATKQEKKETEKFASLMQTNSIFAAKLNLAMTPTIYFFTGDQYYTSSITYFYDMKTVQDFASYFESHKNKLDEVNQMVLRTKKGSNLEKIQAIDELYEYTNPEYRLFLYDLVNKAIELDKKNESGLLPKYIFSKADLEAKELYIQGDLFAASKKYADVAENELISAGDKQQLFYTAALLLSMSGTSDYQTILMYLQRSIDADPESSYVSQIREVRENLLQIVQ